MSNQVIAGDYHSLLQHQQPLLWLNPNLATADRALSNQSISMNDMLAAEARLRRFAGLLQMLFPELAASRGLIESKLHLVPHLREHLLGKRNDAGRLYIKGDHDLPVAGSIKARGGIYEVLCFAEQLAQEHGLLKQEDDYAVLLHEPARALFSRYTVAVGSTGNLGLGIGIMAAALGFKAIVHMSSDAKEWKKERLRKQGVEVREYSGDYARAVAEGRRRASQDPHAYFVDDENSLTLFIGYSVAALRLRDQFAGAGIAVDAQHPLFVYLPCGVGGAPGGITFGLKQIFGDHVHCFFAEPTASPCMLVQLMAAGDTPVSVYDIGLDNHTEADGLAVGLASRRVAKLMRPLVSGIFTVRDDDLFRWLYLLEQTEGLRIEPSAAAGCNGPRLLLNSEPGQRYVQTHHLVSTLPGCTHLLWTTGGSLVPETEYQRLWQKGKSTAHPYPPFFKGG